MKMLMRAVLAVVLAGLMAGESDAGCGRGKASRRAARACGVSASSGRDVARYRATYTATYFQSGPRAANCAGGTCPSPQAAPGATYRAAPANCVNGVCPPQAAAPAAFAASYQVTYQATGGTEGQFLAWLNGVRAQHGLQAVGYDANLAAWAQQNNAHQNHRGIGHFIMGPARRQNSAMGPFQSIGSMWLNSPGHRAALLDPSIRAIGLAGSGSYWTFNAS